MPKSEEKLFGVKILHSREDIPIGGELYGGTVIHRVIISKLIGDKKGFFEYKVSYGQGMREP